MINADNLEWEKTSSSDTFNRIGSIHESKAIVLTAQGSIQKSSGRWRLLLLLILMLHIPASADAYDLEKHLGLYQVIESECELTKGLYNPCPETKFIELVKGTFSGIEPHEMAFVIWKASDDDSKAVYEAHLIRHHKNRLMEKERVWLTGPEDTGHQAYFVLKEGEIIEYRYKVTTTHHAGEIFKRDFKYRLVPVLRSKIKKFDLSYPDAIPSLEKDPDAYIHPADTIYEKAAVQGHEQAIEDLEAEKIFQGGFFLIFGACALLISVGLFIWPEVAATLPRRGLSLPHHPLIIRFLSAPLLFLFAVALIYYGIQTLQAVSE